MNYKLSGGYGVKAVILPDLNGGEEVLINPFTTFGDFKKSIMEMPLENHDDWVKVAYKNNYLTLYDIFITKVVDNWDTDTIEYKSDFDEEKLSSLTKFAVQFPHKK